MAFTRATVLKSFIWKMLERSSVQLISMVVTILLARLLSPEEYGIIALITIFITLADVIIDGGFNTALVQRKDADGKDFSTVFFFSLAMAGAMYALLFFTAPAISRFYGNVQLVPVIRVLSVTLLFSAFNSIQRAYVSKHMLFRKLFYSSFGAVVVSGAVGIAMAMKGFGVWALVAQYLTNKFLIMVIMWFTVRWRPQFVFSIERFGALFDYGWKIFLTNFITGLFVELRKLLIGKFYKPASLAYYEKGDMFPKFIMSNIFTSIQTILLPAFSEVQDDRERVKNMMRRSTKMSCFFIYPMMVGMIVVAEPLVRFLLTDKWLEAVPFLQIFCIANFFRPITLSNLEAIKALGYSGTTLKLEIIKKVLDATILLATMMISVKAIAWGVVLFNFLCIFINLYPNVKLLGYKIHEQMLDALPTLLIALAMGAGVFWINFLSFPPLAKLCLEVALGAVLYVLLCYFFKEESFVYLIDMVKRNKEKLPKIR